MVRSSSVTMAIFMIGSSVIGEMYRVLSIGEHATITLRSGQALAAATAKKAIPQNSLGGALSRERLPAADQLLELRLRLLRRTRMKAEAGPMALHPALFLA